MQDELVVADSAGHTMIDVEAVRAADRRRSGEDAPAGKGQATARDHLAPAVPLRN